MLVWVARRGSLARRAVRQARRGGGVCAPRQRRAAGLASRATRSRRASAAHAAGKLDLDFANVQRALNTVRQELLELGGAVDVALVDAGWGQRIELTLVGEFDSSMRTLIADALHKHFAHDELGVLGFDLEMLEPPEPETPPPRARSTPAADDANAGADETPTSTASSRCCVA